MGMARGHAKPDARDAKDAPIDLGDVFVLRLKDLKMNTEHQRCVLHGQLLQPWAASSREQPLFMNLIEDNGGDRMKLVVLLAGTRHIGLKDLNEWYPPGSRVALKDPWLKVMSDGSVGIRVDETRLFDTTVTYRELQRSADPEVGEVERLEALRSQGNELFKANDLDAAVAKYQEAAQLIQGALEEGSDTAPEVADQLRREKAHLVHSNLAMCFIKRDNFAAALEEADKCLGFRPDFLKGYQRKASALVGLERGYPEATALLLDVIPSEVKEVPAVEKVQLATLLRVAYGGFSNDVGKAVDHVSDERTWFYPEYAAASAEHTCRLLLTVDFTARQRSRLDMPDDVLDDIIDEEMPADLREEKREDLDTRLAIKKRVQGDAVKQFGRTRASAAVYVEKVREMMERDGFREKREFLGRKLADVETILVTGQRDPA